MQIDLPDKAISVAIVVVVLRLVPEGLQQRLYLRHWRRPLSADERRRAQGMAARGMAVADVFDALVSVRSYKKGFPIGKALDIIREGSGTHFDPNIVRAFLDCEDEVRRVAGQREGAPLPAKDGPNGEREDRKDASDMKAGTTRDPDLSGRRFLVVDDMEANREIAAELLKGAGARVEFAEDGRRCVERVSSAPAGHFDLILMDINMPDMDGLEATKRLRRTGVALPIIALTANVGDRDRRAALEAGMDGFCEKPICVYMLFAEITRCLGL